MSFWNEKKKRKEKRKDKHSKNKEVWKKKIEITTRNRVVTFGRIKDWVKGLILHYFKCTHSRTVVYKLGDPKVKINFKN